MKKITYLIAPLLSLSFLASCNKGEPVNVKVGTDVKHLTFSTTNDKELKDVKATKGKDFKFKAKAVQDQNDSDYYVLDDGLFIFMGDSEYPLLNGYTIEYTTDDFTEAIVTITGKKVTGDITINGMAGKVGCFIYNIYCFGCEAAESGLPDSDYLGYAKNGEDVNFKFKAGGSYTKPGLEDFLISINNGELKLPSEFPDGIVTTSEDTSVGTTTLTIKNAGINYEYVEISAKAGNYTANLDEFSWGDIKQISELGFAKYIFNIGDEKAIQIGSNAYRARIIGFNHDKKTGEQFVAGITFQFTNVISKDDKSAQLTMWNSTRTSANFKGSSLYTALNKDLYEALPEELRRNIAEVDKSVGSYSSSTGWGIDTFNTKLFPLAHAEMSTIGSSYDVDFEGEIYTYYKDMDQDNRKFSDLNNNQTAYWLRTPRTGITGCAWTVSEAGTFNYDGAYVNEADHGVVPAFCI